MAAQLIAAHNAAMECYRRAMIGEQTFEGRRDLARSDRGRPAGRREGLFLITGLDWKAPLKRRPLRITQLESNCHR
jgi:hypothetical protein